MFWIVAIFIITIFVLVGIFLKPLKEAISSFVGVYGYFAILAITILVDTMAQPIGPEVPIVAGRVAGLEFLSVMVVTLIGSVIASIFNYYVGKWFFGWVCRHGKCDRYLGMYHKYGRYGLFLSAIGPVPYVPFCWFSGAFHYPFIRFVLFGIIPRVGRVCFVAGAVFMIF